MTETEKELIVRCNKMAYLVGFGWATINGLIQNCGCSDPDFLKNIGAYNKRIEDLFYEDELKHE
jgi:hypothetical protein